MRKRFRDNNEKATILEVGEFADWIHGEVASSIRATEAGDVWRQSCLVPLDENRLRNCLQGNPATAAPEDRSPVFDGRFDSDSNAQRMFSTWSPPRTSAFAHHPVHGGIEPTLQPRIFISFAAVIT
ncbi:uncharacterized protein N7487_006977 [Penicillium crustosum]|uniref:uncharacterized protein n=1 Tax=Penicillium crustosum TaxID=36656 RepID=UPI0023A45F4A|nr:uncharacterized protein N7487_006977 [Penicillium crustosum]KAJ5412618.1 hypothetical protein N7487_006977 [Penicillium crustosum]